MMYGTYLKAAVVVGLSLLTSCGNQSSEPAKKTDTAAAKPAAVVISASEIPGATARRVAAPAVPNP